MQTENKWLNEVDNLDRIDEHPALAGVLANIGRAAVQTARAGGKAVATAARATGRAAKSTAKAAGRAAKAGARKAKSAAKRAGQKAKEKIKQKAKDYVKDKAIDKVKDKMKKDKEKQDANVGKSAADRVFNTVKRTIGRSGEAGKIAAAGLQKAQDLKKGIENAFVLPDLDGETNESLYEFRIAVRKKLIKELLEAEPPAPDSDAGSGKKGMDPEIAAAITKELEGKTVKSKTGKEIKVTSALNPAYKEKDPRAYKNAQKLFKKTADDFFAKGQRKKQGGKGWNPEDEKTKKAKDKKDTQQQSKDTPDQKPDKKQSDNTKDVESTNPREQFNKKSQELDKANKLFDDAIALQKKDPTNPKVQEAVQRAADERFVAQVGKSQAAMGIIDEFKTQKQQIVKDHPNPLSKERRQKLADLKQKKEKAFRETGLEEKDVIHTLNQKDIKDRWDNSIDPTGEGTEELTQVVNGKNVEVGATRINPETGDVEIVSYEVDEDGNKVTDDDGNYNEIVTNEDEMTAKSDVDAEEKAAKEKSDARKEYWKEFFADQFDFSDPIDIETALDLEFGTSGYVAA